MKTSDESGEEKRAKPKTQLRANKPGQSWWQRSKTRRLLRRGTFLAEEGSKETVKFAGLAAKWTLIASAIAGFLYLDYESSVNGNPEFVAQE